MEKLTTNLGQNIKALRAQRGWTQKDLSEKLGCSQNIIASYEQGYRYPPGDKIPSIAVALGVSVDVLYGFRSATRIKIKNPKLLKKFEQIELLSQSDRRAVFRMIDGLVNKKMK